MTSYQVCCLIPLSKLIGEIRVIRHIIDSILFAVPVIRSIRWRDENVRVSRFVVLFFAQLPVVKKISQSYKYISQIYALYISDYVV